MTELDGLFWSRLWKERVSWVMKIVRDGKVCINVNGERSSYFKTSRGLRQGDPLSPLLFNLVVDALGVLLDKADSRGHITGVLDDLIPGGISHIQYANDTVIMIDGSETSIRNLKLILYFFDWLSRLKINYHKSEVFVFGV
jgi:retron-type reverse transcriptase